MRRALELVQRHLLQPQCHDSAFEISKRTFSCSAQSCGVIKQTLEQKLHKINRTRYLHRNDITGAQRVFYRGSKKIDLTKGVVRQKEERSYQREQDVLDTPVDDVYFTHLYKPQVHSLVEAIDLLKEYTELDFTDPESFICLRLSLTDYSMGKGKRKKQKTFLKTTSLPFPHGSDNQICVFSDIEEYQELALSKGAYRSGSNLIIREILNDGLRCDAYLSTEEYSQVLYNHAGLKKCISTFLPTKRFGVSDDFVELLEELRTNAIYSNFGDNAKECIVKVGKPKQPTSDIVENILHISKLVSSEGPPKKDYILKAALNCHCEDILVNLEDINSKE